jgi:hypothetical protein
LRDLRKKFEAEMGRREMEIVEYWRNELERVYKMNLDKAGLLVEMKKVLDRMANRVTILRRLLKEQDV